MNGAGMGRTLYVLDQGLKGLVGHYFEYVRSIVEAAEVQGLSCVVGSHLESATADLGDFSLNPIYRHDVWGTLPGHDLHSAASMRGISQGFVDETAGLLKLHPAMPGDIIFLPNIAKSHVVAAALMAETYGPKGLKLFLMFRYPSSHFDGPVAAEAFRRLERAADRHSVTLCTDSHRLAAELSQLTKLPFMVMPIPHTRHQTDRHLAQRTADEPLHCVSLGNARGEKGIAEILEAVRLTASEPWGDRLRFSLQINDPYEAEEAIERFRSGPDDPRVTLIDMPMSSEAYCDLLESSDIVLVPYHRSVYRERTSGVFLEGLTSGKLLVCTNDTWMSDLFDAHGGGVAVEDRSGRAVADALGEIVGHFDNYQARADKAAAYWQEIHCSENFVAYLTGGGAKPVIAPRFRRAAIFFPWGEAVTGNTGASLLLKHRVRYLETIFDEVRVLFTGGSEADGVIGNRSRAEVYHYRQDAYDLHANLKTMCRSLEYAEDSCFQLWFHIWPLADKTFALRCEELVLWADTIFVDYTYFVPVIDALCRKYGKEYVVTLHDIVSEQCIGVPVLHQVTRSLEFDAIRMAPKVAYISQDDGARLAKEGIAAQYIPALIDASEAVPPFSRAEAIEIVEKLYGVDIGGRRVCLFVGSGHTPNVQAAQKIEQMANALASRADGQDILFVVAGACLSPRNHNNLVALGMIESAGLSACMALSDLVLIPLLEGTGISLKSVEALARGALILSTTTGMRALEVESGVHCRIEDDLDRYPDYIIEMLSDSESTANMRSAARDYGATFDFRTSMARYLSADPRDCDEMESPSDSLLRRASAIEELQERLSAAAPRGLSPTLRGWLKPQPHQALQPRKIMHAYEGVGGSGEASGDIDRFDPIWYRSYYRDVELLGMEPTEHFEWIGRRLGRAPNEAFLKKNDGRAVAGFSVTRR